MNVLNYLGHGIGRAVCELENNVVIKVPFNSNGVQQNREERDKYTLSPGMFAKVVGYDNEKDWLYMEKVDDVSEYFNDYIRDGIHCEIYDELTAPVRRCQCDGKCYVCPHNVISGLIPENVDEIIENKPKDRLQVGLNADDEYKYFDYADAHEVDPEDPVFHDSFSQLVIDYLTEEPEISFEQYLREAAIPCGFDYENPRLEYKKARIAWSKWNNRTNEGK